MFKVLRAHEIEHFFNIGGNDSSDVVRIVAEEARKVGYPLRCIHIPKTIDNDLVLNDHTPGFASAARFVAQAIVGARLDNAALPGVYVGVVMGRRPGVLTAAAALGKSTYVRCGMIVNVTLVGPTEGREGGKRGARWR